MLCKKQKILSHTFFNVDIIQQMNAHLQRVVSRQSHDFAMRSIPAPLPTLMLKVRFCTNNAIIHKHAQEVYINFFFQCFQPHFERSYACNGGPPQVSPYTFVIIPAK